MILRGRIHEDWETIRRRILRETEDYLTECLRHPEMAVQIPAIQVGRGRFSEEYAEAFWRGVLGE